MDVRPAKAADAEALAPLYAQLGYPAAPEAIAARLTRNAAHPDYAAWVAEAEGRVTGFAGGHLLHPWEDEEPAAQIMIMVVDEAARGQGVGGALVATFEGWARTHGAVRAVVGSGFAREGAHRFYERHGYEATGVRFKKKL